ncbi:MAG: hypothetical protein AAF581_15135 [Planctomycetota bacterium]
MRLLGTVSGRRSGQLLVRISVVVLLLLLCSLVLLLGGDPLDDDRDLPKPTVEPAAVSHLAASRATVTGPATTRPAAANTETLPEDSSPIVPRGWLQVRVVDARGEPLAGVHVHVVPPFAGPALGPRWVEELAIPAALLERESTLPAGALTGVELRAMSDAEGLVDFPQLPEAWGYRYGVDVAEVSLLEPPHEDEGGDVTIDESGALLLNNRPAAPAGLSGEFFVSAQQDVLFEARVFRGSVARGQVALQPGSVAWAKVVLHELQHVDRNDDGLVDCERPRKLGEFYPDPAALEVWDGRFEFPDVPVGRWLRVRCAYRIDDGVRLQRCFFATATLFASAARSDFGLVPTLPGRTPEASTIAGKVVFTEAGRVVEPATLYPDPPETALLEVFDEWHREDIGRGVVDVQRLRVGVPFVLHGLSGQRIRLQARPDLDWQSHPTFAGVEIRPPQRLRQTTLPGHLDLPFTVHRTQRTRLVFHYPGHRPFWGKAFLRHVESGRVQEIQMSRPDVAVASNIVFARDLEAGEWELLAHSNSPFDLEGAENWVAERTFQVPRDPTVEVYFSEGRRLAVRAVVAVSDGDPRPLAHDAVSLTPCGWLAADGPIWTFDSPTDAAGVARFVGLPKDSEVLTHLDQSIRIGSDQREVQIVMVDW